MIPAFVLLRIYQGQTFRDSITLENDDGTPIDLTGRTARMQVREHRGGPTIIELTTENGRINLTAQGKIEFHIPAPLTAQMPVPFDYAQWVYDLETAYFDDLEEIVEKPIFGAVVCFPEITV